MPEAATDRRQPGDGIAVRQGTDQAMARAGYARRLGWKDRLDLLEPYIVDKEKRREMPIMGDPDPETLWRLELFYNAVGLAIERETGIMVSPMMKMHHEGFGRMVLTAGRLIVINKHLRDVHRFGFDTWKSSPQKATNSSPRRPK